MTKPMILPKGVFVDDRGFFQEVTKEGDDVMAAIGTIRQINMSRSKAGVLRGIHAQRGMEKAMWVSSGSAQIVAVNLDKASNEFGNWTSHHMEAGDGKIFYAPDDWGRGFLALQDDTVVSYACSDVYRPENEYGINPLTCGVAWDERFGDNLIISPKDQGAVSIKEFRNDS